MRAFNRLRHVVWFAGAIFVHYLLHNVLVLLGGGKALYLCGTALQEVSGTIFESMGCGIAGVAYLIHTKQAVTSPLRHGRHARHILVIHMLVSTILDDTSWSQSITAC